MRGDKTVTRILLIFSIANVVLAAPVVRQRRFLSDGSDDESADRSRPSISSDSGYLSDNDASRLWSPPYLSDDSDSSGERHLSPEFGTDHYYSDSLDDSHFDPFSETSTGSNEVSPASSPSQAGSHDSPGGSVRQDSVSGTLSGSLHQDLAPGSVAPPSNDPPPGSGASELRNDPPSTPETTPSHDDPPSGPKPAQLHDVPHPWWHDWRLAGP